MNFPGRPARTGVRLPQRSTRPTINSRFSKAVAKGWKSVILFLADVLKQPAFPTDSKGSLAQLIRGVVALQGVSVALWTILSLANPRAAIDPRAIAAASLVILPWMVIGRLAEPSPGVSGAAKYGAVGTFWIGIGYVFASLVNFAMPEEPPNSRSAAVTVLVAVVMCYAFLRERKLPPLPRATLLFGLWLSTSFFAWLTFHLRLGAAT